MLSEILVVSAVSAPVLIGIVLGVLLRWMCNRENGLRWGALFESFSLKLFLPLFIVESFSKSNAEEGFLIAFGVGFLLPLLSLLAMLIYKRLFSTSNVFSSNYDDLRFLVSTFGGGNRGTVLVVLLFSGSVFFSEYLKWFVLVDLGNFICLVFVISFLVNRTYGVRESGEPLLWKSLWSNYAVVAFVVVLLCLVIQYYFPYFGVVLSGTSDYRKFLFGFFVFAAIALRFEHGALKGFVMDLTVFILVRIFVGLCVLFMLSPFLPHVLPILSAAIILLLMPPSSLLPSMVGASSANRNSVAYINGFTGAANILYVGLVLVALAFILSQSY